MLKVYVATACDETLIFVSAENEEIALVKVTGYLAGKYGFVPDLLDVDLYDEYFRVDSGIFDIRNFCKEYYYE